MTNTTDFQNSIEEIRPGLRRLQGAAMAMLVIGLLLSVAGFFVQGKDKFFQAYLTSYLFWFGITAGCIGFLMLHHTVGGGWGFIIRRFLEAGSKCLPLLFIAFIPIIIGAESLFEWARPSAQFDHIIQEKVAYLNMPFFIGRFVIYFIIWGLFAYLMNKWAATYDTRSDKATYSRLNKLGAFGLLIHVLLVTFMSVDWVMSLTPHWFSSVFGPLFTGGFALMTLALMNVLVGTLGAEAPLLKVIPQRYFRDLGNFMMALVLVWSYLSFSQYVIQYSGNIAEEVGWYTVRREGGWGIIGIALVFGHFALPFLVLLSSAVKVRPQNLWKIAAFILFMRYVDLMFLTRPTFSETLAGGLYIADIGTFLAMAGAWLLLWGNLVQKRPLVPIHDPRFSYNWAIHEHERAHEHHEHGEHHGSTHDPVPHDQAVRQGAEVTG